jgi:hypothetical protein
MCARARVVTCVQSVIEHEARDDTQYACAHVVSRQYLSLCGVVVLVQSDVNDDEDPADGSRSRARHGSTIGGTSQSPRSAHKASRQPRFAEVDTDRVANASTIRSVSG